VKNGLYGDCNFCSQRLERQLENLKVISPDHPVTVLFTSTEEDFVEFKFVDTENGVLEWTYWIWYPFEEEERKELRRSCNIRHSHY
jgi:hypothetical protein